MSTESHEEPARSTMIPWNHNDVFYDLAERTMECVDMSRLDDDQMIDQTIDCYSRMAVEFDRRIMEGARSIYDLQTRAFAGDVDAWKELYAKGLEGLLGCPPGVEATPMETRR